MGYLSLSSLIEHPILAYCISRILILNKVTLLAIVLCGNIRVLLTLTNSLKVALSDCVSFIKNDVMSPPENHEQQHHIDHVRTRTIPHTFRWLQETIFITTMMKLNEIILCEITLKNHEKREV